MLARRNFKALKNFCNQKDVLDRWGLDEIESVLCPFCDGPNDVEVVEPEELQEESCGDFAELFYVFCCECIGCTFYCECC